MVEDDSQGRGIGKLLSEVVASLAPARRHPQGRDADGHAHVVHLLQRLARTVRSVEDGRR